MATFTAKLRRYELITRFGQGGMAEMQLALQCGPAGFEKLVWSSWSTRTSLRRSRSSTLLLDEARVAALVDEIDVAELGPGNEPTSTAERARSGGDRPRGHGSVSVSPAQGTSPVFRKLPSPTKHRRARGRSRVSCFLRSVLWWRGGANSRCITMTFATVMGGSADPGTRLAGVSRS